MATGLAMAERAVWERRSELLGLFESASTPDRMFAVDRLLKDGFLRPADEDAVASAHGRVRDAWVGARTARLVGAVLAQKQRVLSLMVAEQQLAGVLRERGLFDALFAASEGYLRMVPRAHGQPAFRELLQRREELRRAELHILSPAA